MLSETESCVCPGGFSRVPVGATPGDIADCASADDTRLIADQVRIVCDGTDVMLNQQQSYWQPAGNQLIPAGGSPESSLGPALVLRPIDDGRMPTNSDCELV